VQRENAARWRKSPPPSPVTFETQERSVWWPQFIAMVAPDLVTRLTHDPHYWVGESLGRRGHAKGKKHLARVAWVRTALGGPHRTHAQLARDLAAHEGAARAVTLRTIRRLVVEAKA
jgi:hypothetical protein